MKGLVSLFCLALLAREEVEASGTDSTASGGLRPPDTALRWQFDTGG